MIAGKIRTEAYFWSLLLVVVTLPFTKHYNSLAIGLMVFVSLFTNSWKEKVKQVKDQPWVWLFVAYWLVHATALIYTDNIKSGMFVLEKKSGMWVLPLILVSAVPLEKEKLHRLLMAFVIACTAGLSICLLKGLYWWWFRQSTEFLSYHGLSKTIGIHAVYFSVYLAVSIFILIRSLKKKRGFPLLLYGLIGYLVLGIFLLASKTIILSFLFPGSFIFLLYFFKSGSYKNLIFYILFLVTTVLLLSGIPQTRARFAEVFQTEFYVLNLPEYRYDTPFSGLSLRLVIWKYTLKIVEEENALWTGVGPGDSQDLLDSKYKEIGIYTGNPNFGDHGYLGYNCHDQYFQSLLDLGIPGFLLLLGLLVMICYKGWKEKKFLLLAFMIVFICFLLTESALEAHHGSVFFALFTSLFLLHKKEEEEVVQA